MILKCIRMGLGISKNYISPASVDMNLNIPVRSGKVTPFDMMIMIRLRVAQVIWTAYDYDDRQPHVEFRFNYPGAIGKITVVAMGRVFQVRRRALRCAVRAPAPACGTSRAMGERWYKNCLWVVHPQVAQVTNR